MNDLNIVPFYQKIQIFILFVEILVLEIVTILKIAF
jgi:hypothetical protein